jgi:isochorismate synthase
MTRLAASLPYPAPATRAASSRGQDLHDWARAALLDGARMSCSVLLSVPAPRVALEQLLGFSPEAPAVLWGPPGAESFVGSAVAGEVHCVGGGRFRQLEQAARELLADVRSVAWRTERPAVPRLVGGLAFRVGDAGQWPWLNFGDGWFVLPRLRYDHLQGGTARLVLAVPASETRSPRRRDQALEQLWHARRQLSELGRADVAAGSGPGRVLSDPAFDHNWPSLVTGLLADISAGKYDKVVAARRTVLQFERAPDPRRVLARLAAQDESCTRFAFRRGGATFLGATPEHLVTQNGRQVHTEALAGSIRRDRSGAARELLSSSKDLAEHDFVLQHLIPALAPVCQIVNVAPRPRVVALRHLLHLCSPVIARRHESGHILQLVQLLHPTPAVAGVPTDAALRWIADHEPDPRGWYAGPVGWFDASGDGQFAVALRSGVLAGRQAHLYAGAGIVARSDPQGEYAETSLKLAAVRAALGVAE